MKWMLLILLLPIVSSHCKTPTKTMAGDNKRSGQSGAALQETYWKLTELMGQQVLTAAGKREAHLILKQENNQMSAYAGCNQLGGRYELAAGNRIRFSNIRATMMACPDMELESRLTKVLESADNYSILGDSLSLNKARMAPLARFVAVYMK